MACKPGGFGETVSREYHDTLAASARLHTPDDPPESPDEASRAEAPDNKSSEYALSGASKLLEPGHPNTIPDDAFDYHDLPDKVVAHPEMVPWWVRDDLSVTESRRILKALTAVMVTLAERVGVKPGELSPLLKTVLEVQDTGNDRQDLRVGMETVFLALEAEL